MVNNYKRVLVNFINNIIDNDIYGVRTGILNGKKYCIKAGNAVWHDDILVGIADPEINTIDYIFEGDCYDWDRELFNEYEDDLYVSDDVIPVVADYIDDGFHDNGDYELIPNQLEVSKNYILGKDRKGTFAYAMKHLIGIKNLLILDKCMLSKDWCAVKGYNEEEFSKFVKEEDVPEGCCKSVFDVFKEDLEADYYTNLPYLKEEAVLRGKYIENSKYHKDFAELLSPKDVKLINDAIYSVGIFRNPKLMKDEVGQFDVGEGSFCLLDRDGKLFIASVSGNSPDYMEDRVVPVDSLPRRVYTDLWDYNSCLECIYKLMDFTKNLVKVDIKSLFVFPCESNTMLRFYLVKNSDGSYTVSIIIPYMEIAY